MHAWTNIYLKLITILSSCHRNDDSKSLDFLRRCWNWDWGPKNNVNHFRANSIWKKVKDFGRWIQLKNDKNEEDMKARNWGSGCGLVGLYDFYSILGPVNCSTHRMKYKAYTSTALLTLLKYRLRHLIGQYCPSPRKLIPTREIWVIYGTKYVKVGYTFHLVKVSKKGVVLHI